MSRRLAHRRGSRARLERPATQERRGSVPGSPGPLRQGPEGAGHPPVGEELRRELRDWRKAAETRELPVGPEDPVFASQRGEALKVSGAERIVGNALRRAGIAGKRNPHRLRHTYASRVYRVTRDLRLVQKLLGHSRPHVTAVYAGLFDPDVTAAVNQV